jgi:hypothetical protein
MQMRVYANTIKIGDRVRVVSRDATVTATDGQNIVVQYKDDNSYDAHNPDFTKVELLK